MSSNDWEENWKEDEKLKWDPGFDLGYGEIDDEHRIFHGLIVDFQEAAIQHASKEKLLGILHEITEYAEFHFSSEEKIMAACQYTELDEHAALHHTLLAEARDAYTQFQQDEIDPAHLYEFLLNWFATHTSKEDKKLVQYINQERVTTRHSSKQVAAGAPTLRHGGR